MKILHIICVVCVFLVTLLTSHEIVAKEGARHVSRVKSGTQVKKHVRKPHHFSRKKHETYMSVPKGFVPLDALTERQISAIKAYDECINNEHEHPLRHAMELAYEFKDEPSLNGTPEKLGRESCLADMFKLSRYETDADIKKAQKNELVAVSSSLIDIPADVPPLRRYARVWVRDYIITLAKDMQTYLNGRGIDTSRAPILRIPSIVRSFEVQERLVRNGKSPANCRFHAICSTHTTGSTVDISVLHLGTIEYSWLLHRLLEDRKDGKILVIFEARGGHFHVFVIPPKYVSWYAKGVLKEPAI